MLASAKLPTEAPVNGGRNYKLTVVVTLINSAKCWKLRLYPQLLASRSKDQAEAVTMFEVRTISRKDSS
jgi:hypothetical protein